MCRALRHLDSTGRRHGIRRSLWRRRGVPAACEQSQTVGNVGCFASDTAAVLGDSVASGLYRRQGFLARRLPSGSQVSQPSVGWVRDVCAAGGLPYLMRTGLMISHNLGMEPCIFARWINFSSLSLNNHLLTCTVIIGNRTHLLSFSPRTGVPMCYRSVHVNIEYINFREPKFP